jgi:hypothetical protein
MSAPHLQLYWCKSTHTDAAAAAAQVGSPGCLAAQDEKRSSRGAFTGWVNRAPWQKKTRNVAATAKKKSKKNKK